MTHLVEAKDYILKQVDQAPKIGLVLGSGLGVLAEDIQNPVAIPYQDIPHFPVSTVSGHKGQLVLGSLEGQFVIAMQGRFHYYEGYEMGQSNVSYPSDESTGSRANHCYKCSGWNQ
nr:hypothetical protein [Radiobacillus deserti]